MDRTIDGVVYTVLDKRMRVWGIEDIYTGDSGTYIGYEGDRVYDGKDEYIVIDVDQTTGIAKLEHVDVGAPDLLCYYDNNTTPNTVTVDSVYTVNGDVKYAIAYKGVNQYSNSISEVYDNADAYIDDRIGVARINSNSHEPMAVYKLDKWHTTDTLVNGDTITLVVYDIYDNVLSVRTFTICDVSGLNDATTPVVIRSVDLVTPFMVDGSLIRRPITVTVHDLNIVVKVEYTDRTEWLGLDSERVELAGMDIVSLNNTSMDHEIALIYQTRGDTVNGPSESNGMIVVPYRIRNYIPAKEYGHTLQIYPRYISQAEGYRMSASLMFGDRSDIVDVTNYITYSTEVDDVEAVGMNGKQLGVLQKTVGTLDLKYIHELPEQHNVSKTLYYTLNNYGGESEPGWDANGNLKYITPLRTVSGVGVTTVWLTDDADAWWDEVYPASDPVILSGIEINSPVPTHIIVRDTLQGDVIIAKGNTTDPQVFTSLAVNDILHIEFVQLLGTTTIKVSHMPIYI